MISLELAGRTLETPILQGGMGVGISMGNLAGAVASCGAMGTISTAIAGYNLPEFKTDPQAANLLALKREVQKAKEIAAGKGIVAINAMVATRQYADSVKTAVAAGVDAVVCGAGIALDLPAITEGAKVALAPIVSSGRAAALLCKTWLKRYNTLPDFVVLEGSKAGGHLGFAAKDVLEGTTSTLETLVVEVKNALEAFEKTANRKIPLFPAGGINDGAHMAKLMQLGADGAQFATSFIATHECDASDGYKKVILSATDDDVAILHSPVGMPGRAVRTPLIDRLESGNGDRPTRCVSCLVTCDPKTTSFCIANALVSAVRGDYERGLFFCGSNVGRVNKIIPVKSLLDDLVLGCKNETNI